MPPQRQICASYCSSVGAAFAGVQNGHECFCGSSEDYSRHGASTDCTLTCQANPAELCGGFWAIEVGDSGPAGLDITFREEESTLVLHRRETLLEKVLSTQRLAISAQPSLEALPRMRYCMPGIFRTERRFSRSEAPCPRKRTCSFRQSRRRLLSTSRPPPERFKAAER